MDRMIAYCGLICSECPAYIARKENSDELRKKTAAEWSKQFGHEITPEQVDCDGCLSSGVLLDYCNICEIRKCGIEKKVENCAFCDDYICERLETWFKNVPDAKKHLEEIRKNK